MKSIFLIRMKRIILLQNGLGNQMFEYAFYLTLKQKYPKTIISTYLFNRRCDHNGLEINRIFPVSWEEDQRLDFIVRLYRKCHYLSCTTGFIALSAQLILKALYWLHIGLCIEKPEIPYSQSSYIWKDNYRIFWGGWMSEQWFASIKDRIRQDFTFDTTQCSQQTQMLLQKLSQQTIETVAIHIRRGDYLQNPQYLDICDKTYYETAIRLMKDRFSAIYYYIFSDDTDWCKKNLPLPLDNTTYVDWNQGAESWQDMLLMSHCRHNIIANSSFSWWAAWLNANPDKIVVCPRQYSRTENLVNVMPDDWIKI